MAEEVGHWLGWNVFRKIFTPLVSTKNEYYNNLPLTGKAEERQARCIACGLQLLLECGTSLDKVWGIVTVPAHQLLDAYGYSYTHRVDGHGYIPLPEPGFTGPVSYQAPAATSYQYAQPATQSARYSTQRSSFRGVQYPLHYPPAP